MHLYFHEIFTNLDRIPCILVERHLVSAMSKTTINPSKFIAVHVPRIINKKEMHIQNASCGRFKSNRCKASTLKLPLLKISQLPGVIDRHAACSRMLRNIAQLWCWHTECDCHSQPISYKLLLQFTLYTILTFVVYQLNDFATKVLVAKSHKCGHLKNCCLLEGKFNQQYFSWSGLFV